MKNVEYQLDKYILIVEDNWDNMFYLDVTLKKLGVTKILKAVDGDECIKLFKKHKDNIFLVFMDIRLPFESGYDVIPKLLKMKKVNIIIQSAAFIEDKSKATNIGCVDYITKPFTIEQIKKSLDRFYSK